MVCPAGIKELAELLVLGEINIYWETSAKNQLQQTCTRNVSYLNYKKLLKALICCTASFHPHKQQQSLKSGLCRLVIERREGWVRECMHSILAFFWWRFWLMTTSTLRLCNLTTESWKSQ